MIRYILKTNPILQTIKQIRNMSQQTAAAMQYKTLDVTVPKPYVYHIQLNRPKSLNALDATMWHEYGVCFQQLAENPDCRVILLSGAGKLFCAGIDFKNAMSIGQELAEHEDIARKCKILFKKIKNYQDSMSSAEKCPKPVIAAVHGACIGAGIDMISATDIRYCTADAWFQIKEIDLGMAADVGTLQRFPKIIGCQSLVRELAFTGRKFTADEALKYGFVSRIYDDEQKLIEESIKIAEEIANKSPVAVQTTKINLNYSRDHTVEEGLDHIATYNQAMLQSEDFMNSVVALATKGDPPTFSKL